MGNRPQLPETAASRSQPRNYIIDPRYGGKVILSEVTGTVYQCHLLDQRSLPPFQKLLAKRKQLKHPNLLTVQSSFSKQLHSDALNCGNQPRKEIYIEYVYLPKTLQDVLEDYSKQGKEMPERQMAQIFEAVVDALYYLKVNRTCHGDVKASNILFDHLGIVKIVDSYFVSGGKTAYQIVLEDPSSMSLLSPQQLERIKNRQFEDIDTIYRSQMFAVGLTMLECMTCEPAMECYDLIKLLIKEDYVREKVGELRQSHYSRQLVSLVTKCLSTDPQERPDHHQFLKAVRGI